jgi:hypothetical protein
LFQFCIARWRTSQRHTFILVLRFIMSLASRASGVLVNPKFFSVPFLCPQGLGRFPFRRLEPLRWLGDGKRLPTPCIRSVRRGTIGLISLVTLSRFGGSVLVGLPQFRLVRPCGAAH